MGMNAPRGISQPTFLSGHPRRRAGLLGLILTVPISLFFVAAWRLDPADGFTMIGLGFISVYLFAYLPWVVWLAYRVCGLSLGWLAGIDGQREKLFAASLITLMLAASLPMFLRLVKSAKTTET